MKVSYIEFPIRTRGFPNEMLFLGFLKLSAPGPHGGRGGPHGADAPPRPLGGKPGAFPTAVAMHV